jgi:sucrose synthase
MLNDRIQNPDSLQHVLRKAEEYLGTVAPETPYSEFEHTFQEIGLERGWGATADRVLESIQLLLDLLEAPDPCTLETFLDRIPMVFNVVILSPHGYFAQDDVLGYPDTGGQVSFRSNVFAVYENLILLLYLSSLTHMLYLIYNSGRLHLGSSPCLGERDAPSH